MPKGLYIALFFCSIYFLVTACYLLFGGGVILHSHSSFIYLFILSVFISSLIIGTIIDLFNGNNAIIFIFINVLFLFFALLLWFAVAFKKFGVCAHGVILHNGFAALYLSVMTLTSVGYGDYVPATKDGQIFAMIEAVLGYFVLALIVAAFIEMVKGARRSI